MGERGQIILVNGTTYDWTNTGQHSDQMNAWGFPATIPAGTSTAVDIEWDQNILVTQSDDAGEVTYTLSGTAWSFQLQARATSGFDLQAAMSVPTEGNAPNAVVPIGFDRDGYVVFALAGTNGNFVTNTPPGAWMQANLEMLGGRTLRELCMPGAHDGGMSMLSGSTLFGFLCNTQTQTAGVLGQLQAGARYFDIRPVIAGGQYTTGHYQLIDNTSWQGGNGQSIASIIKDVNQFTAANAELVILDLSHDLDTDLGNTSYASLTQQQWDALLTQLLSLQHRFVTSAEDLSKVKLSDFIGNGQAAVVVIVESSGISLGNFAGQGFYTAANFPLYNQYADSNDVAFMTNDQLQKMRAQRPNPDASYFLLSWTLTQDDKEAAMCEAGLANSILDLAAIADPQLYLQLLSACTPSTYPSIIYVDNVQPPIAAMAMAVNTKASGS